MLPRKLPPKGPWGLAERGSLEKRFIELRAMARNRFCNQKLVYYLLWSSTGLAWIAIIKQMKKKSVIFMVTDWSFKCNWLQNWPQTSKECLGRQLLIARSVGHLLTRLINCRILQIKSWINEFERAKNPLLVEKSRSLSILQKNEPYSFKIGI